MPTHLRESAMIRITLPIIFVSLLSRVPIQAMPYFILAFALISIVVAGLGIRNGYLHHYDILDLTIFFTALAGYIASPERAVEWMINNGRLVVYPLFAITTLAPPLLLRRPVTRIIWKGTPSPVSMVTLVLWGTTFILSSIMLWLGARSRTPFLIIAVVTIPVQITLAYELNLTWGALDRRRSIQQGNSKLSRLGRFFPTFSGKKATFTYDFEQFLQLSDQQQHQRMQEWLSSIATVPREVRYRYTGREEQRQHDIRQLLLAIAQLDDADKTKVIEVRTIVLARMPMDQIKNILRSRFRAMQKTTDDFVLPQYFKEIDEADRAVVAAIMPQMPTDVQQITTQVVMELRGEFLNRM